MEYVFKDFSFNKNKNIIFSLTKIKGMGLKRSENICGLLGFNKKLKFFDLNKYKFTVLTYFIKKFYKTDIYLIRKVDSNLKKYINFRSYKAIKYSAGLPIRGQKTRTNAKTTKKFRKILKNK